VRATHRQTEPVGPDANQLAAASALENHVLHPGTRPAGPALAFPTPGASPRRAARSFA